MDLQRQKLRLGIFVTGALILLAVLILMFGGSPSRLFIRQNEYRIEFADAPGISVGTPVRRSGVKIGSVTKVELNDKSRMVDVWIAVDSKYTVWNTDEAVINQDLLSRDSSIDLVARPPALAPPKPISGQSQKSEIRTVGAIEVPNNLFAAGQPAIATPVPPDSQPLPSGSTIPGRSTDARSALGQAANIIPTVEHSLNAIRRSAERIEKAVPQLEAGAREFTELGRALREAVPEVRRTNDEIRLLVQGFRNAGPEIRKTNEELQVTLRNFGAVAERFDVFLAANQTKIAKAIDQTTDVLQRLSNVLSEENQKNFTATLRAVQQASNNFDSIARNADQAFVNINAATKPFADRGERLLRNLDGSIDQLNRILGSVAETLGPVGGQVGGGTIQKLFTDPSLYNNLNEAACIIAKTMPRLDRILRDIEVFADKIARHPESIGVGGAVRPSAGLKEGPSSGFRQR